MVVLEREVDPLVREVAWVECCPVAPKIESWLRVFFSVGTVTIRLWELMQLVVPNKSVVKWYRFVGFLYNT